MNDKKAVVIGGGLAGVEAAHQLSKRGIKVTLYEMKPKKFSPAHKSEQLAELVCSNSLKAERVGSAAGLLKAEMRLFDSVCLKAADIAKVPAGGALAVDRDVFSNEITKAIEGDPNITLVRDEITEIPDDCTVVVAAGPLMSDALAKSVADLCGKDFLAFYDAAAPIVTADSIDMENAFTQSRYDRGGEDDYINCPLDKAQYEEFYEALINAESAELHSFDKRKDVYEGCMPIEVLASRGKDAMRYGPLKPVGLTNPKTGHRPWANLQLRKENKDGTMYNLVGFQTNLKFPEQKRVFSMFPALKNAEFVRYGVMHRNTFLNSPGLLSYDFSMKKNPRIYFAGQISGVEGYMESAMSGILAAISVSNTLMEIPQMRLPETTMCGALSKYISTDDKKDFQPMGANFGILPREGILIKNKQERYQVIAEKALADLKIALEENLHNGERI